jgi:hypothetical protein
MTGSPTSADSDHVRCSFEALARSVLSLDTAIEWIALEQAGREMRWGWRDTSSGEVRTGGVSADLPAVDPLLLLVAEGGEAPARTIGRPPGLLFVLVAYADITQIVARWGADAYVSVAVGIAVDAHELGRKLMSLLSPRAHATMVH